MFVTSWIMDSILVQEVNGLDGILDSHNGQIEWREFMGLEHVFVYRVWAVAMMNS